MCSFLVNNLLPFLLATEKSIGNVWMNRQSGVKILLSGITAPIVLAPLKDFLSRQCHVNSKWSNNHPANFICLAYLRFKHICTNTIGIVNVHILHTQSGSNGKLVSSFWPKIAALRLFIETMHTLFIKL